MSRFSKTILTLGILTIAGCTTTGQPVSDNERTRAGALIGGLLGAGIGATADDNRAGKTVAGAAIGAALGGVIGQQLDRQARDLEAQIGNPDVRIENTGSELIVTLPQDILFATDSATLSPSMRSDLRALATNLQQYPSSVVRIFGHTDSTGPSQYNLELSARRATSVARELYDGGVAPARVIPQGRGEEQPVASNLTEAGKAQNRRVEIVIQPTT